MSERPFYKRYPSDFIAGTIGLSLEEKGAYSLILDLLYDRWSPIPDDPRYIAGVCGVSVRRWNAIRSKLIEAGKIIIHDGHIDNHRAEKERENELKRAKERSESGAKGGKKSAENKPDVNETNDLDQAKLGHTHAFQKPEVRIPLSSLRSERERAPEKNLDREKKKPNPKNAARLPENWRPSEADVCFAQREGLGSSRIQREADKFRDYWIQQPDAKARKKDWSATWRNWIRNAADGYGSRAPPASSKGGNNGMLEAIRKAREHQETPTIETDYVRSS